MAEAKCAIKFVDEKDFIHVLRVFNANIKGTMKVGFALSIVKGIGLRLAHVLLKVARIDPTKRAGELTPTEVNRLNEIVADPKGIPKLSQLQDTTFHSGCTTERGTERMEQTAS